MLIPRSFHAGSHTIILMLTLMLMLIAQVGTRLKGDFILVTYAGACETAIYKLIQQYNTILITTTEAYKGQWFWVAPQVIFSGLLGSGYSECPKLDYISVTIVNKHSSMASCVKMSV